MIFNFYIFVNFPHFGRFWNHFLTQSLTQGIMICVGRGKVSFTYVTPLEQNWYNRCNRSTSLLFPSCRALRLDRFMYWVVEFHPLPEHCCPPRYYLSADEGPRRVSNLNQGAYCLSTSPTTQLGNNFRPPPSSAPCLITFLFPNKGLISHSRAGCDPLHDFAFKPGNTSASEFPPPGKLPLLFPTPDRSSPGVAKQF
jgi:hypothetical protein